VALNYRIICRIYIMYTYLSTTVQW